MDRASRSSRIDRMETFLRWNIDRRHSNMPTMQISNRIIEPGIIACLFLIAIFAPHSIAATQTAWLVGMALWLLRFAFYPRPRLFRSQIDYVLLGFFVLSGI